MPLVFVQCDKSDDVAVKPSLDETLSSSSDMSILKAAIAKAKLETFTKGPGPFTIFTPTDAAFTAAGITSASCHGFHYAHRINLKPFPKQCSRCLYRPYQF